MMNYDLAIMALDGLVRSRITVSTGHSGGVVLEGSPEAFKHLARLCLLLGGEGSVAADAFELQPGSHLDGGMSVTLRRT